MTERRRYWNEDTQSWEDGSDRGAPPGVRLSSPPVLRGGSGRSAGWAVVGTVTVVVVTALLVWLRPADGGGSKDTGKPDRAASSDLPSGPTGSGPATGGLPAGYEWREGKGGSRTAVPKGWSEGTIEANEATYDVYTAPVGDAALYVSAWSGDSTPEQSLRELEEQQTGYRLHEGPHCGDHEQGRYCTVEYEVGDRSQRVTYRFTSSIDDALYGVDVFVPRGSDRVAERTWAKVAFEHFCPPHAPCQDESGG